MFSWARMRSSPRLDMEVATTRWPVSLFCDFKKRAAARSTPSPLTTFPVSQTNRARSASPRSEEHTSELQSRLHLVCRLLLEKKMNPHDRCHSSHQSEDISR